MVVGLTGCSSATSEATDGVRSQIAQFEERLDRVIARGNSPLSTWKVFDPANENEDALLDTTFTEQTGGPYAFSHEITDETLTLDIYVSVWRSTGGGIFVHKAQAYSCATYVITPRDHTFTGSDRECPDEAIPSEDALTEQVDVDL